MRFNYGRFPPPAPRRAEAMMYACFSVQRTKPITAFGWIRRGNVEMVSFQRTAPVAITGTNGRQSEVAILGTSDLTTQ